MYGVPKDIKSEIEDEEGPNGAYDTPFPIDKEDFLNT